MPALITIIIILAIALVRFAYETVQNHIMLSRMRKNGWRRMICKRPKDLP